MTALSSTGKLAVVLALPLVLAMGCAGEPPPPTPTATATATATPEVKATTPTATPTTRPPTPTPTRPVATPTPTFQVVPTPTPPPRATGTLTISEFEFGTESWLPWESTNQAFYWEPVYERLINLDPATWAMKPGLAKSWSLTGDGRTLTYQLQQGVQFQAGWGEMTSADVVYTIEQFLTNPNSTHPSVASLKGAGAQVSAVDKYTVKVEFTKTPYLTGAIDISSQNNGVGIMSKAYMEKVGEDQARRKPIGTGPYRFRQHNIGSVIEMEALDTHWKAVGQWKTIRYAITPEATTRLAQILAGEADIVNLPGSFARQLKAAGAQAKIRTLLNPGVSGVFLVPVVYIPGTADFGTPDPNNPMADPKFREALSLAINRQELADVVYAGGAVPTGQVDLLPASLGYDPAWEKADPFDLDRAKKLLQESGKAGLTVSFSQPEFTGVSELPQQAEAIAGMWERLGLKVNVALHIPGANFTATRTARKLEGQIWQMRLGHQLDPTRRLTSQYNCKTAKTSVFTCDERLDALTARIVKSTNLEEKAKLLHDYYALLLGERIVIPVVQTATLYGIGPKVGNWQPRLGERFTTEIVSIGHAQ